MRRLRVEHLESRHLLSAAGAGPGLIALDAPPVVVWQSSTVATASLANVFCNADGSPVVAHYGVVANTNRFLFSAPPVTLPPGLLLFHAAPNGSGTAEVTIRATDAEGETADCTVTIQVGTATCGPSLPRWLGQATSNLAAVARAQRGDGGERAGGGWRL